MEDNPMNQDPIVITSNSTGHREIRIDEQGGRIMKIEPNQQHAHPHQKPQKAWQPSVRGIILILIFVIIGYYLFTEHRAHVTGFFAAFPWWILLLFLCPLMHLFHGSHRGHSHHENHPHDKKERNPDSNNKD
jgi:amino acid permease